MSTEIANFSSPPARAHEPSFRISVAEAQQIERVLDAALALAPGTFEAPFMFGARTAIRLLLNGADANAEAMMAHAQDVLIRARENI